MMKIPLGESADFSMEGEKLFTTDVVHWLQSIFTAFWCDGLKNRWGGGQPEVKVQRIELEKW
jgi:hypothetical protein